MKTITYIGRYKEITVGEHGKVLKGDEIKLPDGVADQLVKRPEWREGKSKESRKEQD